MATLLDAGALVAIDKGDRRVLAMLRVVQHAGLPVRTSAAVVAQVWHEGSRQSNLARVLAGVDVHPLGFRDARLTGELLASTKSSDVVDAHFAFLAQDDDQVLTSDPKDIERLLAARRIQARLILI